MNAHILAKQLKEITENSFRHPALGLAADLLCKQETEINSLKLLLALKRSFGKMQEDFDKRSAQIKPLSWMTSEIDEDGDRFTMWTSHKDPYIENQIPLYPESDVLQLVAEIQMLRERLQEAVDGMGGSYAIWAPKAKEILK